MAKRFARSSLDAGTAFRVSSHVSSIFSTIIRSSPRSYCSFRPFSCHYARDVRKESSSNVVAIDERADLRSVVHAEKGLPTHS